MGEVKGFLQYQRKDPGYRARKERLTDFRAVELSLSDNELGKQAARCMECGTPFCHGFGCALSNPIPEMNDLVYEGRWEEALHLLLSTNPFPEFTGRLCPAPCEAACVLGINDEPVTVRQLELAIIEKAFEHGTIPPWTPSKRFDERIAVIGSGPSGLAAADVLNKAGYRVVVYESAQKAGGLLRYGIPDFKLEKWVLDRRIDLMQESGIAFELGVTVGHDISYKHLAGTFDALCLCGGSREPRDLHVPGRDLKGIHFAIDYLVAQNKRNAGEQITPEEDIDAKGKSVVIIGGGDTGSDCLGTALRQGATSVCQLEVLPEPPGQRPRTTPWPMWPNIRRDTSSHQEGGERRWSVGTQSFHGGNGHVTGLSCVEVHCKQGPKGQLEFEEKSGTRFDLEAQLVLLAMGYVGPGPNKVFDELGLERDTRANICTDSQHMTSVEGVFAAGDMAIGQSLVTRAIADGRDAANAIMRFLKRKGR